MPTRTLAGYGLTQRPSARSIASSAASSDPQQRNTAKGGNAYEDAYNPQYSPYINLTQKDVEARVRAQNPELFYNESQVRAKVLKDIAGRTDFGKSTRAKFITTEVKTILSANKSQRASAIEKTQRELMPAAIREAAGRYEEARQTQRAGDVETYNQGLADQNQGAQYQRGNIAAAMSGADEDTAQYLQHLDLSMRVAMKENPNIADGFENYVSYAQQLANMSPEEREAELGALREEANAEVDPYYDEQDRRVKEDLKNSINDINAQAGLFDEGQKYQLGQKIDSLDRNAAQSLADSFVDMKKRGVLSSGITKTIADKIIEGKGRAEDFEKTITDFQNREYRMKKDQATNRNQVITDRNISDIETERGAERKKQFFGLLSDEESKTFLQQYAGASRLNAYDNTAEQPSTAPTSNYPTSSRNSGTQMVSSVNGPVASAGMSLADQRALRDKLLNPSSGTTARPAPAPSQKVVNSVGTPSRTPINKSTMPGTTLLQRAAARGAARTTKATSSR